MKAGLKAGVSGVRGLVGESFTPRVAMSFAQAFGVLMGGGKIVVGRDTRTTGGMVEEAVTAGLLSVGCQPVLTGIVPTPTVLILTQELAARGGIVITASHNPAPWNALKFVEASGMFLNAVRADELLDVYYQQEIERVTEPRMLKPVRFEHAMQVHVERVLRYVDAELIRSCAFRVAVDCCNGVGALHSADFLCRLGCEVFPVLDGSPGVFEREPEPLPGNLSVLCGQVREAECAVGFAQDPDGDRLAIVDEQGCPIGEDLSLALAAWEVLEQHGRGPVVANLSTSRVMDDVAQRFHVAMHRSAIGEINVAERMLEVQAVAGGEGNGGVIVPAVHPCRDSYVGMALVLELMARKKKNISAVRDELPRYELVKDKVALRPGQSAHIMRLLRQRYADCTLNLQDGVFVDYGKSWVHGRPSNTEPIIRLMAEAPTREQAQALLETMRGYIREAL